MSFLRRLFASKLLPSCSPRFCYGQWLLALTARAASLALEVINLVNVRQKAFGVSGDHLPRERVGRAVDGPDPARVLRSERLRRQRRDNVLGRTI